MRYIYIYIQDTMVYMMENGATLKFEAALCEKKSVKGTAKARFSCWRASLPPGSTEASLSSHEFMYSIGNRKEFLLQFQFPLDSDQASQLTGLGASTKWSPIRPSRWSHLHQAALDREWCCQGTLSPDFHKELFCWDYRVYVSGDSKSFIVPLAEVGEATRSWYVLDAALCRVRRLEVGKPGVPVYHPECKVGPDGRLSIALARLKEAPAKLQLNSLSHQRGWEEPLMRSGLPFRVGNLAAPRSGDKQAAFSILRMPVFGASFGVRSRMDQPLGGTEVSVACLGSADNAAMSTLDNETRRVRQGNECKEATALLNKKATTKANLGEVLPDGRAIVGPAVRDAYCHKRKLDSNHFCMGIVSNEGRCKRCKTSYQAEELISKKRLLNDIDQLQVFKKMRPLQLPAKHYVIARGDRCYGIKDIIPDTDAGLGAEVALTRIPDECRLSSNREVASVFPVDVVYTLGNQGKLQISKGPDNSFQPLWESQQAWLLPKGHFLLCEKYRVSRGHEHMNEPIEHNPIEMLTKSWRRQTLKRILKPEDPEGNLAGAEAKAEEKAEETAEDDGLYIRTVTTWENAIMQRIRDTKQLREHLEGYIQPRRSVEADDCQEYQFDQPLVGLDFEVLLLHGKNFCALPQVQYFGSPIHTRCKCNLPSKVALLKYASEAERCIVASRSFQGSYSTICPSCLRTMVEKEPRITFF